MKRTNHLWTLLLAVLLLTALTVAAVAGYFYNFQCTIGVGETVDMATLANGWYAQDVLSAPDVWWTSSNTEVVTVDYDGYATGLSAGTAVVTAHSGEVDANFQVTVKSYEPTGITISPTSIGLRAGETRQLLVVVYPTNHTFNVSWSSSNARVATVDANGVVQARASGTAMIQATCGPYSASCTVTVKAAGASDAPGVQTKTLTLLSKKKGTLKGNETKTFSFYLPFDATVRYVNHGETGLIVKVYSGSSVSFDSETPVTGKTLAMDINVETNTSFSLAIKNPDLRNETTYNFSLVFDVVATETISLDQTSFAMPKGEVANVGFQGLDTDSSHTCFSTNKNVADVSFSSSGTSSRFAAPDGLKISSKSNGSADILVYNYYYDKEEDIEIPTDLAVLHVDVKEPKVTSDCLPGVTGQLMKGESDTLPFTLSKEMSVKILKGDYNRYNFSFELYDQANRLLAANGVTFVPNLKAGTYKIKVTGIFPYGYSKYGSEYYVSVKAMEYKLIPTTSL